MDWSEVEITQLIHLLNLISADVIAVLLIQIPSLIMFTLHTLPVQKHT